MIKVTIYVNRAVLVDLMIPTLRLITDAVEVVNIKAPSKIISVLIIRVFCYLNSFVSLYNNQYQF